MEENQTNKVDMGRRQYFDNLRRYQEQNDKKQQQLSNFLNEDIHQLAKKDEERYINAVKEKDI
jgi:hypothetical protein